MRPTATAARAGVVISHARSRSRQVIPRIYLQRETTSRLSKPIHSEWTSNQRHASTSTTSSQSHGVDKESVQGANPSLAGPSNLPASTDLLEVYRGMVAQGRLAWDEEQVRIVMKVSPGPCTHPNLPILETPKGYASEWSLTWRSFDTYWTNWQNTNPHLIF
jgi:hypothetical protein